MQQFWWRGLAGSLIAAALLPAACSAPKEDEAAIEDQANQAAATHFANRMSGQPPPPAAAKPFQQSEKTPQVEFLYAYPAQAAQVPELVAKFQKALTVTRADALKMAREDEKAARQSDFPFHAHESETRWTVTADTPRFLALQSENYSYTGGAHGMTGYDALLWDRARSRETRLEALMTAPAAFAAVIHDRFCAALDKARAEKRGAPVKRGDDDFTQCIDPMKQVLVPTSKDGKLIDGVTVVIGPYSAGPYAEGSYEIALPVDAAIYRTIKTEYQDAFTGG